MFQRPRIFQQPRIVCRLMSIIRLALLFALMPLGLVGSASAQGLTFAAWPSSKTQVGQDYYQINQVSGGTYTYTFSVVAGSLPSGTRLDSGIVTGFPNAEGPFSYTIEVVDTSEPPLKATQTVSGTMSGPAPLTLVSVPGSGNQVGQYYWQYNWASGGTYPFNFTVSGGALPAGMSLNAVSGDVGGYITATGSFSYTITVTDSATPPQTTSQSVSGTNLPPTKLEIITSPAAATVVGQYFYQSFSCIGGIPSCVFGVSGTLPVGVVFDVNTGLASGLPTTPGNYSFTITATDGGGAFQQTASLAVNGTIAPVVGLTLSSFPAAYTRIGYYFQQDNVPTGGFLPYTFSVSDGSLPPGTSLQADYGNVYGFPTVAGPFSYTIKVTDSATPPQTALRTITGTIIGLQAATTTTLSSSPNPSLIGQPVVLSAQVAPVATTAKLATGSSSGKVTGTAVTGTVEFRDGNAILCAAAPLTSGAATCTARFPVASTHSLSAVYSGSSDFFGSTSTALVQTVNDQRAKTAEAIGKFIGRRNDSIMSNQADGSRQIDRLIEAGGGGAQGSSNVGSSGKPANGGWQSASQLGARFGGGPDASDLSRLRFGQERSFLLSDRENNVADRGINGPISANGNTDGLMRFGFATSLRDVARYAVESEARKAQDAGLGLTAGGPATRVTRPNPFDIWIEGKFSSFRDTRADNNLDGYFGLVTVGTDYVLNRALLFGTMVQFDNMRQSSKRQGTEVSGRGWMAGPYATVRVSDNVFWQSRFAWGRSSNEISPFMTYTDTFQTTRWLTSSTLAGRWEFGAWSIKPSASVSYMEDVSKGYADTFGALIPVVRSSLGQAKVGPEVSYRYQPNGDVVLEPHAGVQIIWNFAGTTTADGFGVINGDGAGPLGVRGRAEVGLRATRMGGLGLDIAGSYDGIGVAGYNAFTGKATMRMPLN
jgi:outer membrane autotransporter protein